MRNAALSQSAPIPPARRSAAEVERQRQAARGDAERVRTVRRRGGGLHGVGLGGGEDSEGELGEE